MIRPEARLAMRREREERTIRRIYYGVGVVVGTVAGGVAVHRRAGRR